MNSSAGLSLAAASPMSTASDLQIATLAMGLAGGLALFLYGMEMMADALKAVAGDRMRLILQRLTSNRWVAAMTGAFVTAIIQSSSVTTVMVVSFITAGLMSLSQSIGVIMGANIGTTFTAQIIAFKVTKMALLMIAAGFAMTFLGKREGTRQKGAVLMGLGLVFFGMSVMSDAMNPLRSYQPFLDSMIRLESPMIGILVGAAFTALIQSSSATTGIVIVMASQALITLPAGIALAFGANVGTCVTAMLASIGRPREALRASLVHVLFNIAGVLLWLPMIDWLAEFVSWVSPSATGLTGQARLAAETPRQIANAHTTFNLINTVLFLPFATQFARLVERLVPDRPMAEAEAVRARYLDVELLGTPSLAIDRVRLELLHQGEHVRDMMERALPAILHGGTEKLDQVKSMDDAVDNLHGQIVTHLGQLTRQELSGEQTDEVLHLLEATNSLENIGDIIETNLVLLGRSRIEASLSVSEPTEEILKAFHTAVLRAFDDALLAVAQKNSGAAKRVVEMKQSIDHLADSAAMHEAQRLVAEEPNRLRAYTIEVDILNNFKRIYYFTRRMARSVSNESVAEA